MLMCVQFIILLIYRMKAIALILGIVALCSVESRTPVHRLFDRREPPPPVLARDANVRAIETEWIGVPLDHFSSGHTPYFGMRYMTNDQFFVRDGSPIFIMLGGEWSINEAWLLGGNMFVTARDLGGYMIYTEHRYYGLSWPAANTETPNMKHLIIDQALADVIDLIKSLKRQPRFAKSKIIVFGGSYAGNMATWIRYKYPEYIDGALSSSAPVLAKADFFEYLETVNDALRDYGGEECVETIRRGVEQTQQAIMSEQLSAVQRAYKLCSPLDHTNKLDVQTFFSYITGSFSGLVQTGNPTSLNYICNTLLSNPGNDMEKLGKFINDYLTGGGCYDTKYKDVVNYYQDTSYSNENLYTVRLWLYQTCTEYGYYQTTNSTKQPFGDTLPVSHYSDNLCADFYGPEFTAEVLEAGIKRTNELYHGLTPDVTKVFQVHGSIDPWHRLGILEDLNEESPTYVINGTSHCVDLQTPNINDIPNLVEARKLIRESILKWIAA